jgi:large repetitive protein
VSNN